MTKEVSIEGALGRDSCNIRRAGNRIAIMCQVNDAGSVFYVSVEKLKELLE